MARPLLSGALIVRNEESYLEGCLASLHGIVDEVVVVDTGSSDRTIEIARSAGARVFESPWMNDFSAARNEVFRHCAGDWLLWIDADERLRPFARAQLAELLSDGTQAGYYVLFHRRPGFPPNWQLRLLRHHPGLRFEGAMHESIYPAVERICRAEKKEIGYSGLVYDHLGYERNQERKNRRNLPLLLEASQRQPENIYIRCHLARTCAALGDNASARAAWEEGVALVRKKQSLHIGDSYPYVGLIELELKEGNDPTDLVAEAREMFPDHLQLLWHQAWVRIGEGRYQEAIAHFRRLIWCGRTHAFDHSIGYDRRLLDEFARASIDFCRFLTGECPENRGVPGLNALSVEFPGYYGQIRKRRTEPDPALYRFAETGS